MKTRLLPMLLAALCAALSLAIPGRAFADHPQRAYGNGYGPPPGRVTVVNESGGGVTVGLSGQSGRYLAPWQSATFSAPALETTLRATYLQFGAERTLQTNRLYVTPGRTVAVTLAPERMARVLVTNRAPFEAQLLVDGKPAGTFSAGASRVIALAAGSPELVMTAQGRVIGRTRVELRPFAEPTWSVDVPRTGDLVVKNPLPIPVTLVCDRNLTRTVQPYSQAVYADLPAGGFHLTARRVTGEFIDDATSEVRVGQTVTWSVDPPSVGSVELTSLHFLGTEVRFDGRRLATLGANGTARAHVTVGWHEVVVTDERGRVVSQTWIEVKPFEIAQVRFGTPPRVEGRDHHDRVGSHDGGRDDRDDDHDHDDHRNHGATVVAEAGGSCGMSH